MYLYHTCNALNVILRAKHRNDVILRRAKPDVRISFFVDEYGDAMLTEAELRAVG